MIAYQTNSNGVFVGTVNSDESPLEPGVFLLPAGAVTVEPPAFEEDQFAVWDGEGWMVETFSEPEPEPMVPIDLTRAEVEEIRRHRYQETTDPLFFEFQRGDATEQAWLDAVQAVKDANPYPEAL